MEGPSPTDALSVEFELTPEEWVETSLEHSARSPLYQEAVKNVRLLFGALVVVAALLSLLEGSSMGAIIWLLAGGTAFAVLKPLLRRSRRKQLLRFAATGIANGMFGRHRVELRPEGMVDSTDGYEWLTRWSAIERVEESENAFLVYSGPNAYLLIPHSAFRDSDSLRRFSDVFYTLREAGAPASLPPSSGEDPRRPAG